jgi:hypothetical protein
MAVFNGSTSLAGTTSKVRTAVGSAGRPSAAGEICAEAGNTSTETAETPPGP